MMATGREGRARRIFLLGYVMLSCGAAGAKAQALAPYLDPKTPVDQRVADLLSRMTVEEKVAQMIGAWENAQFFKDPQALFVDEKGNFLPERAAVLMKNGIGEISRPSEKRDPRTMAEYTNTVQKWVKQNTRLGIPVLFHDECLHGHVAPKATSYPQAIALASTWDTELVQDVFTATAGEARARGVQHCLAPVLDLARDPRWGRTEETYGEDPYLVSHIGLAAIRGFQGNSDLIDKTHVMATAKHFAVHGQPEAGTNVAPGNYSERVVREYFMKPFEVAVKEGHIRTVMPSYNEVDGIPSHSNKYFLDDILRKEWGFSGAVTSDYFGITELRTIHHIATDDAAAARYALDAGVDLELPFAGEYPTLVEQIKEKKVSVAAVDRAVTRILRAKFTAGLFEDPFVDVAYAEKFTNNAEHQKLALKAAREAIILLKNEGGLLPLGKNKYKRIAVIGPNAAEVHLGGYSNVPGRGVSVLQGIKDQVGSGAEVLYAEGCKITETLPDWDADKVVLGDAALNAKRIQEAVAVAARADVVILALGGNEQTSREAWSPDHKGDRDSLDLLGNQDELVKAILGTGKPVVVFLQHGRPNSINYVAENVPAILEGWYLGQEGGTAVADVIFGDYNPGGKLPITVPRNVGQLPDYYYYKPSAKREYLGTTTEPLFPFGWGLSYSTFTYAKLQAAPQTIDPSGRTKISVQVTNASSVRGDEVVQMYVRQEVSSVTRAIKELRGFRRVALNPGESRVVEFSAGPEELQFLNREMKRVVEPGVFTIMVGGSSAKLMETKLNVTGN
jgi:beta-glucosidase